MGIPIPVEAKLDERSATAAANRAERVFAEAGKKAGQQFSSGFNVEGVEQDLKKIGDKASDTYDRARDAAGKLRAEEERLQALRERGARNDQVVAQAERVEKARRAEIRAIRDATNAYEEYEQAAESAGKQGAENFNQGLNGARAGAATAGSGFGDSFAGGFAGAGGIKGMGGMLLRGGGWALAGVAAGKLFGDAVADGLATIQMRDVFQGRMGLDEASMAQYASAAGAAYANNWGASVADNLGTAQVALQSGIIDTNATEAEVQSVIEQLQGMATVTDATTAELSRSITTMMRSGLAGNVSEASDIIVAGFQNGLDVSGDWLDTINEYSTQFRKLGLDAGQVLTLLSQGMEGGARDTDKVADSLKEFSIRAVDGSKATREGFEALGFNADEMGRLFAEGGETATVALSSVFTALRGIEDPMQQGLIWTRLFGTQFEDMGDAINQFDMSNVAAEFTDLQGVSDASTKSATDNWNSRWDAALRTAEQRFSSFKVWLADAFTDLPGISQLPDMLEWALSPPISRPTGPSGQMPNGYVPTSPLPAAGAPRAQGPGLGPYPTTAAVDDLFGAMLPPAAAPAAPAGPEMQWDWRTGGLVPAGPGPASGGPVPGARTPILTDAQAEAAKEAEKAAAGGGSLPSAPVLPMQYTPTAGLPTNIANAQARIDETQHALAEKQARLNQLELGNLGTAEDIQKAHNDVVKAERDVQQAEAAMHDTRMSALNSQTKQLKTVSTSMGEIGAALDADLGISKGLPGLADNLVRFLASLAAAPLVGQLSAISNAHGDEGSGLVGMLASTGALGPRFMPGYSGGGGGGSYIPGMSSGMPYGLPGGTDTGGYGSSGAVFPAWVHQLEQAFGVKASTYSGHQEGNRNEPGYAPNPGGQNRGIDWSGPVDAMQRFADYLSQIPGALEQVIWQNPNTGQTTEIAGGRPQPGYFSGDLGGHQDHVHTRQSMAIPTPGGVAAPMGADWLAMAQAESSGNWQANTGNGFYGGLQFLPSSWDAAGGPQYAPRADLASPQQQIAVAENLLAMQGPGAWPNTFVPAGGGGGTLPGVGMVPQGTGPGGGIPGLPAVNGVGAAAGAGLGGQAYPAGPAGGGIGMGGMAMDGLMAATAGLDMMMPGAGAAAKIGIQLANRTAKYGGQVAGILTGGFLDTITPAGDNPKASIGNSWLGRLAGGIAGASAALPNMAGKQGAPPNPNDPNVAAGQGGNTIHQSLTLNNNHATEDMAGNQAVRELGAMYSTPGSQ